MNDRQIKGNYAGLIQAPESWWLSQSRFVYDAWDWPLGEIRDAVLSAAKACGLLHKLGPSSMTSAQAMAAAMRVYGHEVTPEKALEGFQPHTPAGYDFVHGTGQFAPDEEHGEGQDPS